MAWYEPRRTELHCNNCGHVFQDRITHVAIESDERSDPLGWVVASPSAYSEVECPNCASRMIGPGR
jgi:DNA-directed RNA polymerase subunit RPC12/RpoP